MKNFFTSLLGAFVALVIFSIGSLFCLFMFFVLLGAAMGGGNKAVPSVERGAYLVFDMSANITDAPEQFDSGGFMGALLAGDRGPRRLQLRQVTRALEAAATDGRVAGVFLLGGFQPDGYGSGFATLKEVREALEQVRAAKKPVIAYLETPGVREMYVASLADELVLDPFGEINMPGLASTPVYFANAFEKFGIGVQVARVGKYKSALEPFTRSDMSEESREQMQKLLGDIWGGVREGIASGRGMGARELQRLVDGEGVISAKKALERKLVTRLAYYDEVLDDLKTRTGCGSAPGPFKQVSLEEYARTLPVVSGPVAASHGDAHAKGARKRGARGGTVAVVYAEGAIVNGRGGADNVGDERFTREIRALRQDDSVKAIVVRVNSPGGSASASEHIVRELALAREDKPVVVSMGAYAASGGYWITTASDRIFAQPSTITGSIGVFGGLFDVKKLAGSIGITFDSVKTGKFADTQTITRPKTPEEMAIVQRLVDHIYDEFLEKVSKSREMTKERVQEIAQGRVWSGADALKLGLVDEIGGLDAAIAYAARKAGLGANYRVREFPRKKEFAEAFREMMRDAAPSQERALAGGKSGGVMASLLARAETEARALDEFNDPRGIYARLPLDMEIK